MKNQAGGVKVGLIKPPSLIRNFRFFNLQPPLNLAMLGAYLNARGVEVEIRDFDVEPLDDLEPWLERFQPDLVGMTAMTPMILGAAKLAERIRRFASHLPVVIGGPHASAIPERTLREFPQFDFAVSGEGEVPLAHLVESLGGASLEGIPGLTRRQGGEILVGPPPKRLDNLDALPLANRSSLPLDLYRGPSFRGFSRQAMPIAEMVTSRGCPVSCIFCHSQDRLVRMMSAERVAEDLEICHRQHKVRHIVFMDDVFTCNRDRLAGILAALRRLKMTFNCTTRADTVDAEMLREMVASGCRGISFGVDSGSPRILELVGKKITIEKIVAAFDAAHAAGVRYVDATVILGSHPDEELGDIEQTMALVRRIRPTILGVATVVPYPGTPLRRLMIERGLLSDEAGWEEYLFYGARPSWRTEHFTMAELAEIQGRMLRAHYFSWRYLCHLARTVRSIGDLRYYLASAVDFLRSYHAPPPG
ncbi:MAG: B12-binding domain-containing radical SAM protein [Burkholderiales bacterium]|nr:B12-binding domain-containing radical SAM protein [Burkholderiales bacterium]